MLYLTILVLICLSGLFSGLTLGFLGLDASELKRKADLGDQRAKKIYSVRKNGNLLLCTLLIGNVAVNSAISIVLSDITSGVLAGVLATFLIVVFGEIFPQATFYRYAMKIGHYTVWLVKFFIFIFYPVCWPLSKILDKILGQEIPKVWSRAELREIIKYHEDSSLSDINSDEERIMLGALSYSQKKVAHVMTP
ncbi:DUF21 domain-containing protein, partial [Patescibacteria group bacterium]|nr:DUF21 domain-containing protein [Patescibacteria group bacterium]